MTSNILVTFNNNFKCSQLIYCTKLDTTLFYQCNITDDALPNLVYIHDQYAKKVSLVQEIYQKQYKSTQDGGQRTINQGIF